METDSWTFVSRHFLSASGKTAKGKKRECRSTVAFLILPKPLVCMCGSCTFPYRTASIKSAATEFTCAQTEYFLINIRLRCSAAQLCRGLYTVRSQSPYFYCTSTCGFIVSLLCSALFCRSTSNNYDHLNPIHSKRYLSNSAYLLRLLICPFGEAFCSGSSFWPFTVTFGRLLVSLLRCTEWTRTCFVGPFFGWE